MSFENKMALEGAVGLASATVAVLAQASEFVSDWGRFSATAITGAIAIGAIWMHFRTMKEVMIVLADLTRQIKDLVAELRERPCVRSRKND